MNTVTISARCIRAVMPCAATTDIRYYLNAVALKKGRNGGVVAVGADGNTLAFAFDPGGTWTADGDTVIIRRANGKTSGKGWKESILSDIATLKPGSSVLDVPAVIELKGGSLAACTFTGVTREGAAIEDAHFPDVSVWADPKFTADPVGFNPDLLAQAFDGVRFFTSTKHPSVALLANGDSAATVVPGWHPDADSRCRFAAIVMPLRRNVGQVHPAIDRKDPWPMGSRPVAGLDWLRAALLG